MALQDKWGFLIDSSALVLASTETAIQKEIAQSAPWLLGALIQVCAGAADDVQINAAIAAV